MTTTPDDTCAACGDLRRHHPGDGACELCARNAALFGEDVVTRCGAFVAAGEGDRDG